MFIKIGGILAQNLGRLRIRAKMESIQYFAKEFL